ncbi:MAG: 5'/3'-nucleotidase SurE, partial [Planctomycetota bacterium]
MHTLWWAAANLIVPGIFHFPAFHEETVNDVRVLITNDDGFNAPGIAALRAALSDLGQVDVVAPEVEQSGKSHAITYLEPLFVHEVTTPGNHGWVVGGTPADCVKVAVTQLCDPTPDLIVSG